MFEIFNILGKSLFTTIKAVIDIYHKKTMMYELAHKFPNHLRLRVLGNEEILRKGWTWQKIESSGQSPFQE